MGYTWFRAESLAVDHPKVMELATLLDAPLALADGYLFRLWSWVHRYAPTGVFSARAVAQLELYIGRTGVIEAMRSVGLIEARADEKDTLEVHDWWDLQGALVEKAEKDSKRKKAWRKKSVPRTSRGRPTERPAPSRVTARVHDETDETNGTNETSRDKQKPARGEPRRASLRDSDLLEADFEDVLRQPYAWAGAKDGMALGLLLTLSPLAEVRARWRRGLNASGWHQVRTVAQLHSKWNDLATGQPVRGAEPSTDGRGTITAREVQL